MEVVRLYIKGDKEKGFVDQMILQSGLGIVGQAKGKDGDRQISILSLEDRRDIQEMSEPGLCTGRFRENITIHRLEVEKFHPGDQVNIGNATIEVTKIEKDCFPQCPLVKNKKKCSLTKGVIYARVVTGGVLQRGDKVSKI